jgi:hypothetical protein
MSDRLGALLSDAADARVAGEPIPPVGVVRSRAAASTGSRSRPRRRLTLFAPVVAAGMAALVAVGAYAVGAAAHRAHQRVVPVAPTLGPVVPPLLVREKLGAPPGHTRGPAVPSADGLAVSPSARNGVRLRTAGVMRPHATPDAKGHPRLDRCIYTYSQPGESVQAGRCEWALSTPLRPPSTPLTLSILGAPGHTWLSGSAPVGTAAVLLRAPGRKTVAVATGDPGPTWQHRPFYVAWWPRTGTDVIAVNRAGRELARTRLPSDMAIRRSSTDPQLGTAEAPFGIRDQRLGLKNPAPPPTRVDVLARTRISSTVTLLSLGFRAGENSCIEDYVQDTSGTDMPTSGAVSCGLGGPSPGGTISLGRSFVAGTGKPQEQLLTGSAPSGTARIRLSSVGRASQEFEAYDGGDRWQHRAYFIAPWPSAAPTRVTALDRRGRILATTLDRGLDPRAFDADYLAVEAACLRSKGVTVIEHAQGRGVAPAYEFRPGTLTTQQVQTAQATCEQLASRQRS